MSYTFNKIVKGDFEEIKTRVIESLRAEKFGVITEIDMQATIKNKLNKDMQRYEILGACSPKFAYETVMLDEDMGAFLPCNITLSEKNAGEIKISIVNPVPYMSTIENEEIKQIATNVAEAMKRVSDSL